MIRTNIDVSPYTSLQYFKVCLFSISKCYIYRISINIYCLFQRIQFLNNLGFNSKIHSCIIGYFNSNMFFLELVWNVKLVHSILFLYFWPKIRIGLCFELSCNIILFFFPCASFLDVTTSAVSFFVLTWWIFPFHVSRIHIMFYSILICFWPLFDLKCSEWATTRTFHNASTKPLEEACAIFEVYPEGQLHSLFQKPHSAHCHYHYWL